MTKSNLQKAFEKATNAQVKADIAIQKFASLLRFEGFDYIEPTVAAVNEDSILISYGDAEMYAEDAIALMEKNGVITINDFVNPLRFKKGNFHD